MAVVLFGVWLFVVLCLDLLRFWFGGLVDTLFVLFSLICCFAIVTVGGVWDLLVG